MSTKGFCIGSCVLVSVTNDNTSSFCVHQRPISIDPTYDTLTIFCHIIRILEACVEVTYLDPGMTEKMATCSLFISGYIRPNLNSSFVALIPNRPRQISSPSFVPLPWLVFLLRSLPRSLLTALPLLLPELSHQINLLF